MGKFTKENARENQAKSRVSLKANRDSGKDVVNDFITKDVVELVFVTPYDEALAKLKNPKNLAERICAEQIADKKRSWQFFNDICDRLIGKPRTQADISLNGDMNIVLDTTGLYGD